MFVYSQVNLDPNIRNIQELRSWPEFHNAVAAGLRLAPLQVQDLYIVLNSLVLVLLGNYFILIFGKKKIKIGKEDTKRG